MKILDKILVLAIVVTLSHTEEDFNGYVKHVTAFNYHTKIGIPKAAKLSINKNTRISDAKLNIIYQIVGGQVVHVKDVPYQVGLIITLKVLLKSVCGGSLISSSRVLTAGHCYSDGTLTAEFFEVVLGTSKLFEGGQRFITEDIAVYPEWNPKTIGNDLAILRIPPVTFTHSIQSIALPGVEMLSDEFVGWTALASGYGITGDDEHVTISQHLSSVSLTIISNAACANVFHELIKISTICTQGDGHRSTCHGDSGGPLVVRVDGKPILVGITSFGALEGCNNGLPVAYTRITSYVDWIVDQ